MLVVVSRGPLRPPRETLTSQATKGLRPESCLPAAPLPPLNGTPRPAPPRPPPPSSSPLDSINNAASSSRETAGGPQPAPRVLAHTPHPPPSPRRTRFSALIGHFPLGPPTQPPGASPRRRGPAGDPPRLGPEGKTWRDGARLRQRRRQRKGGRERKAETPTETLRESEGRRERRDSGRGAETRSGRAGSPGCRCPGTSAARAASEPESRESGALGAGATPSCSRALPSRRAVFLSEREPLASPSPRTASARRRARSSAGKPSRDRSPGPRDPQPRRPPRPPWTPRTARRSSSRCLRPPAS